MMIKRDPERIQEGKKTMQARQAAMQPLKAEKPRKAQRQQRAMKAAKAPQAKKRFRLKKQPPAGYMTTAQAADYLGVSVKTIRRYIQLHGLPAEKPGGVYLIERTALDQWARMNG